MKSFAFGLSVACLMGANLFAQENYIEIGGGFLSEKNNFSTDSKSTISNYGESDSDSRGIPYGAFNYTYHYDNAIAFYLESQKGDVRVGTAIDNLNFGFVIKPFAEEEWSNPFLLNQDRSKTDVSEMGGYVGYTFKADAYKLALEYQVTTVDYDNDALPSTLKRDATRHILSAKNSYKNYLLGLEYEKYDADGKASAYDKYMAEVGYQDTFFTNLSFFTALGVGAKEYDATNPILGKKIDATILSATVALKLDNPMDFGKNTYVSLALKATQEDANHDFYDKEQIASIVSVGYKF